MQKRGPRKPIRFPEPPLLVLFRVIFQMQKVTKFQKKDFNGLGLGKAFKYTLFTDSKLWSKIKRCFLVHLEFVSLAVTPFGK